MNTMSLIKVRLVIIAEIKLLTAAFVLAFLHSTAIFIFAVQILHTY